MKGVKEKMQKIIKDPIAKSIFSLILVVLVAVFSSFVTGKNMQSGIASFTQDKFTEAVELVLEEKVIPQLNTINITATTALAEVRDLKSEFNSDKDETCINNINKYYEKYKKGDVQDFTQTNYEAMTKWWKKLPDSLKDDALKTKYTILIDYYSKVY